MSWKLELAQRIEQKKSLMGEYPPDWPLIARRVKTLANWICERCGKVHELDGENGFVLTVHHLDGNKWNLELWNLAALCQRCHLRIQHRVDWYRHTLDHVHSLWMARHIKNYNVWAWLNDKPQIPIAQIVEKDYSKEWSN